MARSAMGLGKRNGTEPQINGEAQMQIGMATSTMAVCWRDIIAGRTHRVFLLSQWASGTSDLFLPIKHAILDEN
jgi:hypothetical protein